MAINDRLVDLQNKTINSVYEQLKTYGKSMFVRPTGFGKTYLLVERIAKDYIRRYPNKKVLYIYPLDIIKTEIAGKRKITQTKIDQKTGETVEVTYTIDSKYLSDGIIKLDENFEFISYQKLSREYNVDNEHLAKTLNSKDISLIILDEVHRAGAQTFYDVFDTIRDKISDKGIHLVGATATPNRMDDSDVKVPVLDYIFDNKQVFKYDLGDAIKDGLIPEICYKLSQSSVEVVENKLKPKIKSSKNSYIEKTFNTEIGRLRGTLGDEKVAISDAIIECGYDLRNDKYFKFIVFVSNRETMLEQATDIEEWFDEAFNNNLFTRYGLKKKFKIRVSYLVSQDADNRLKDLADKRSNRTYYNKTKDIEELNEEPNCVDLIFTIDMVNMGYHVPNITGIAMLRGTKSEITYYQQLGRALSVSATHKPIVLDFVNNVLEKFWAKKDASSSNNEDTNNIGLDKDSKEALQLLITSQGTVNAFEKFMERFGGDGSNFEKEELGYLYNTLNMPIYLIAAFKHWTLLDTVKKLKKCKFTFKDETNQYKMIMDKIEYYIKQGNKDKAKELYITLHYINCSEAVYGKCKYIRNKAKPTLYNYLHKI